MIESKEQVGMYLLGPITEAWGRRIEAGKQARQAWMTVANMCDKFFRGDSNFMWKDDFRKEFMPGMSGSNFQITLNKAFELVAIFGPTLFWQYPHRKVQSYRPPDETIIAQILGQGDEQTMQAISAQSQQDQLVREGRNSLMELYLNWSQREQPGGLAGEAEHAITEALVKGRGLLWTEAYSFPGDPAVFTGSFFDSVENLIIDPDCKDPQLRDCMWIARRHVNPIWQVERMFGYPRGYLSTYGTRSSAEYQVREEPDGVRDEQQTFDRIEWYEIWSRGGIGGRIKGVDFDTVTHLEDVAGDFAYICYSPKVKHPLNLRPDDIYEGDDDSVREKVSWRTANFGVKFECWRDGRWPVEILDFYPQPRSAWPIPPIAPGLGELIGLNILTSAFIEQAWENRKQIISVLKEASDDVENALKSTSNPAIIKISRQTTSSIRDLIQFLDRPKMNTDMLKAIDYLSELFDKRTGLSEIMYAMSSTQARVAADVRSKEEKASIRPEKMSRDVAEWMSNVSGSEMILAALHVKGESLRPLLGDAGGMLWDMLVGTLSEQQIMREMTAFVEANDVRRPNRERDISNLQTLAQTIIPVLAEAATGGQPEPFNAFVKRLGDTMEMNLSDMRLEAPQADPEVADLQKAQLQADVQKTSAEAQAKMADVELKSAEAGMEQQKAMMEMQLKAQQAQAAAQIQMQKAQIDAQVKQQKSQLDIAVKQQQAQVKNMTASQQHQLKLLQTAQGFRQETTLKEQSHTQDLIHKAESHSQDMRLKEETSEQDLEIRKEQSKVEVEMKKAQAKAAASAKPKVSK